MKWNESNESVYKDGREELLGKRRARIAVPAEMVRLSLKGIDLAKCDSIEVRAHAR